MSDTNYEMKDLISISEEALKMPAGVGDPILAANSESWAPYNRFLHMFVKQYTPHVCLELGVYLGTATSHMALGCSSCTIIGVDKEYHPDAKGILARYPNVVLFDGYSTLPSMKIDIEDFLHRSAENNRLIGLLFLDSRHDGQTPKQEFLMYRSLFEDDCLVVCDDLLHNEEMEEFWRWLPGEKQRMDYLHPALNKTYPEPGFGVSIIRDSDYGEGL